MFGAGQLGRRGIREMKLTSCEVDSFTWRRHEHRSSEAVPIGIPVKPAWGIGGRRVVEEEEEEEAR
jgi:hypothetical protein